MCPFLFYEQCSFRCLCIRVVIVKPFFNAYPAAIVADIALNRIGWFVRALGACVRHKLFDLRITGMVNNLPGIRRLDAAAEGLERPAD